MASPVLPVLPHNRELQPKSSVHSTNYRSIRSVHQKLAVNYLSVEMVTKILIWLPVKIILRFKCVCKSWCKLISSEYFIDMHLELTKRRPRLIIYPYTPWGAFKLYSPSTQCTADLVFRESGSVRRFEGLLNMQPNACQGLNLLLVGGDIYVINVWTREVVGLPEGTLGFRRVVGLGFSSTSKKYKVVRLLQDWDEFGCEVYTLGGGSGRWRKVCVPPYRVNPEYAFSNGAIHWTIDGYLCSGKPHAVVSFSVEDEKFALVPLPPPTLAVERTCFFAAEGCLCVTYANFCREQRLDLWMLKDYQGGVWTLDYTLDLRHKFFRPGYEVVTIIDGNIWFLNEFNDEIMYFDAKTGAVKLAASIPHLNYYDPEEGSMRNVLDGASFLSISLHEESLVSLSDKS